MLKHILHFYLAFIFVFIFYIFSWILIFFFFFFSQFLLTVILLFPIQSFDRNEKYTDVIDHVENVAYVLCGDKPVDLIAFIDILHTKEVSKIIKK